MTCPVCNSQFCDHTHGQKNGARQRINKGLNPVDVRHEEWLSDPSGNPFYNPLPVKVKQPEEDGYWPGPG
jgi:hypothetical protein